MIQGPHKDFNLHTIGWQAFQDLAATIVEVDQGRPVSRVAKSKDEGRDGFLYGVPDEPLTAGDARETTIQCKHFDKAGRTLTLGSLTTELTSVRKLASSGRADGYMLITNASVTEAHRVRIVEALRAAGVTRPYVLGGQWVVEKILASPKVRALAPRVYGLGDLSWLKSDQARRQAAAILDTMGDDLRCYVPTKAHDDAVEALDRHGSVLLLGDPAVGKSSIAAALSVAATDEKDCDVIFVRNPAEFLRHWDPEVENRLFWVDDAFGSTKLETALMDPWNKVFSGMHAAIRRGNRFILTSRSHIWNEARRDLKQGAYAPLLHGHVVVDVAALKHAEQERILYNHLKFGSQDAAFVRGVRQFLDAVLAADSFRPEVARRLANPLYTGGLRSTEEGLLDFFARPEAFLRDTLMNLSDAQRAAIGLIFINGGRLRSPIEADEGQRLIETLYGVGVAGLRNALETLDGSFVLRVRDGDHAYWTYKHPTIGDGYALLIKSDQELVTLYVRGAKVEQLLDEAYCGGRVRGGILIPPELHATFLERLPRSEATADAVRRFLVHRSGEAFFKAAVARFPKVLTLPRAISRPYARDLTARMRAKAAVYGCMTPPERSAFIHELRSEVADSGDVSFLTGDTLFDTLLSDEERDELEDLARTNLDGRFDAIIDGERDSYDSSWEPDDWFADVRALVEEHATLFPDDQAVEQSVARALKRISSAVETIEEGREPEEEWDGERSGTARTAVSRSVGRSIFDDLVPSP